MRSLCLAFIWTFLATISCLAEEVSSPRALIVPVHEEISDTTVYLVRRGLRQALEEKFSIVILDINTPGGRLDATDEIMKMIDSFPGTTISYVNKEAFSAGALITFSTDKIFMAPQSVIGAAAPVMVSPLSSAPSEMPSTMETKITSALSAKIRGFATKNGHNSDLAEAMINKTAEFVIDGQTLKRAGDLLTLTDAEAGKVYGSPERPLLSSGTIGSREELYSFLGVAQGSWSVLTPTGMEKVAFWLNKLRPLLLLAGIAGIYLELKTPGFGAPGIIGGLSFVLYFGAAYVAGLSGWEWFLVFFIGLALILVEFFFLPGTLVPGLMGAVCIVAGVIMAVADFHPSIQNWPSLMQLARPMTEFAVSVLLAICLMLLLARWLPKTPLYSALVSTSQSGEISLQRQLASQESQIGAIGLTISILRPGGKARFGSKFMDVLAPGCVIPQGSVVKIVGFSGSDAMVEQVEKT